MIILTKLLYQSLRATFQDAKKGRMLGIELERPVGDSSGTYKGTHMFTCPPKHGIFCDTSEAVSTKTFNLLDTINEYLNIFHSMGTYCLQ